MTLRGEEISLDCIREGRVNPRTVKKKMGGGEEGDLLMIHLKKSLSVCRIKFSRAFILLKLYFSLSNS